MSFLPSLPDPLGPLDALLRNAWWTWTPAARALVASIDPALWAEHRGRVSAFAHAVPAARWQALAVDEAFVERLHELDSALDLYLLDEDTWWNARVGDDPMAHAPGGIAYFSAEFGVHEGWPIYSGGLGVLAGDHLKSASDLGLPFLGVTLLYRRGYFTQSIADGHQRESFPPQSPESLGLRRAMGAGGQPLEVFVPLYDRFVRCAVWQARVGRALLLLLDADVLGNRDEDRQLTWQLYGGDSRMRVAQELLLGVGGLRAVRGMGFQPSVLHLNEGHCAFVTLERFREERERGHDAETAWAMVRQDCVFTTHTPVPAGHDRFWTELVAEITGHWREEMGLSVDQLMDTGRVYSGTDEQLCMTVLALHGSRFTNGVSLKHGEVSRGMWQEVWRGREVSEVPIDAITNGVHASSWVGPDVQRWLDKLPFDWRRRLADPESWPEVLALDGAGLWRAHEAQKATLRDYVRHAVGVALPEDALLLGFARRFAPYKRGDMLVADEERIARLLRDPQRPVAILYAGKAHPRDDNGKAILARVVAATKREELAERVVFLPDYDIGVGRALVQGVDVWVNTPRRPLEASGTSGQKVSMNGGLNCSTLDGWWIEGFAAEPRAGWGVGSPEVDRDVVHGDRVDAEALYRTLEQEIVPLFFDRKDGLPRGWIERMQAAIATCLPRFNTDRMVADYVRRAYDPQEA